jgi:hypothetical protein
MKRLISVLIVAVLAVPGVAFADALGPVDLTLYTVGGHTADVTTPSIGWVYTCPYYYQLSVPNGSTAPTSLAGSYSGFCLSLTTEIYQGTEYTDFAIQKMTDVFSRTTADQILKLFTDYSNAPALGSPTSPAPSAASDAMSVALWAVLQGAASVTVDSTTFTAYSGLSESGSVVMSVTGLSSDAISLLSRPEWLRDITGDSSGTSLYTAGTIYALINPDDVQRQEITLLTPGSESASLSASVPEPAPFVRFASLALVGLPIGAIVLYRRRRRA